MLRILFVAWARAQTGLTCFTTGTGRHRGTRTSFFLKTRSPARPSGCIVPKFVIVAVSIEIVFMSWLHYPAGGGFVSEKCSFPAPLSWSSPSKGE
jgi:hypothetical protein